MIKGTDHANWDDIWYISNQTDKHLCYKLDFFCNIKESFMVNKLDNQMKLLFTYRIGEVVIKDGGQEYLIPGVHYASEVTLNILSIDLLEKQGFEITYENNRCSLDYMFNNTKSQKLDEDRMRTMQNQYLEDYFESLAKKYASTEEDLIQIKGRTYSTKVNTFNEYVAFLNLIKQDEVVSQEWDKFRKNFDRVVKWFYNYYLDRSLPGPIPPKINGVQVHLFDLYKLVESLGGYLNVFTSYYKTARVPQQEYESILKKPTRKVEEDKYKNYLMSHQWDFGETCAPTANTVVQKGKEKLEHFGVKLEDEEEAKDNQL
nr:ARID DNA-binding domain-containing protein [Tanacetum cinerariifolium]